MLELYTLLMAIVGLFIGPILLFVFFQKKQAGEEPLTALPWSRLVGCAYWN